MGYIIYYEIEHSTGKTMVGFAKAGTFGEHTQFIFDLSEIDGGRGDQIHFFTDNELNSNFEHKRVLHKLLGPLNYNEIVELYYGERARQTLPVG